jgi:thiol-disulfide isomerase/thioredoxin
MTQADTAQHPKYFDPKSDFWREVFERAEDHATYLANSPEKHAEKWHNMAERLPELSDEQIGRLRGYNRRLNVLVSSGVWCGDCVRQVPMIKQIADAIGSEADLRIIDRDADERLRDELRVVGAERVPMAVFLSEDFWELGRFGDRSLTAYRAKAQREVGAACSLGHVAPPADELAAEQAEWIDFTERMLLMLRLAPALRQRYGD